MPNLQTALKRAKLYWDGEHGIADGNRHYCMPAALQDTQGRAIEPPTTTALRAAVLTLLELEPCRTVGEACAAVRQHIASAMRGAPPDLREAVCSEVEAQLERQRQQLSRIWSALLHFQRTGEIEFLRQEADGPLRRRQVWLAQLAARQGLSADDWSTELPETRSRCQQQSQGPLTPNFLTAVVVGLDATELLAATLSCSADCGEATSEPPVRVGDVQEARAVRALSFFEAYCGSGSLTRALHVNHGVTGLLLDTDPAKLQWDPEVLDTDPKGAGRRFIRSNPDLPLLAMDVSRSGALTSA